MQLVCGFCSFELGSFGETRAGESELYFQMLLKPELELGPSKFLAAPAPIQLYKRCSCSTVILLIFQIRFNFMFIDLSVYLKTIAIS